MHIIKIKEVEKWFSMMSSFITLFFSEKAPNKYPKPMKTRTDEWLSSRFL